MKPLLLPSFLLLLFWGQSIAQNKQGMELPVRKAQHKITVDGLLDEPDWHSAFTAKDFYLNYPVDSLPPDFQSEVKMTFDEQFLYFGIFCHDIK